MARERKAQKGNNVPFCTTVTPFQAALIHGEGLEKYSPIVGTRVPRGTLSDFLLPLIDRHFSEKYGFPLYILEGLAEEAGILIPMEVDSGKQTNKCEPIPEEVMQDAVRRYKEKLVGFMYGEPNNGEHNEQ
jgi:hypothetical protein